MSGMKENYNKTVTKELAKSLDISNRLAVPRIKKVVINTGVGRLLSSAPNTKDLIQKIENDLALITGQRPIATKAKKSIASFKVREGQTVGLKVTLRGQRMFDFLDRFVKIALPRSRDFKGIPIKAIDQDGNLTIGVSEHTIFPETSESSLNFGFEVTVVTNSSEREESKQLLRALGFPLKKENE